MPRRHDEVRWTGRPAPAAALLEVRRVTLRFGGVVALDEVSFDVMQGQICGLIGPNGGENAYSAEVEGRMTLMASG